MRIGSDEITIVWNDPWVRHLPNFRVQSMVMQGLEDLKVSDLLLEPGCWNESLSTRFLVRSKPQLCVGNYFLDCKNTIFQFGTIRGQDSIQLNLAMICYCP